MADNGRWSTWGAAGNTLPEHHSALALLQQLDHAWFHDNLLKPRIGLINAFRTSSDPPLSPYQSIELMDATHTPNHRFRHGGMPCTRFENQPCSKAPSGTYYLSKDSNDNLQSHQKLRKLPIPSAASFTRLHVSSNPPLETILCSAATMRTRSVKYFKDFQVKQIISRASKLDSVESGKQLRVSLVNAQLPQPEVFGTPQLKAPRKCSKSMTALKIDELQGSMDVGFQFNSQDDLTPRVLTLFSASKHKLIEDGEFGRSISGEPTQRSCDAWLVQASLHDRQIPATNEDIKEHLKFWARAVASTVRQEC